MAEDPSHMTPDAQHLHRLALGDNANDIIGVLNSPETHPDTITHLMGHSDHEVRQAAGEVLAAHPDASLDSLRELGKRPELRPTVMKNLLGHRMGHFI